MFFLIPKSGASTPISDGHDDIRSKGKGHEVTKGPRSLLWLSLPLTFPRAHPRVGSKPPTRAGPQPDIPRCSRLPKAWLGSAAVQGGEGQVNGSLETTWTSPWKRSPPPHSHCLRLDPPRSSCVVRPPASVGVGRHLQKVRVGQEGVRLLGGRPSILRP